MLFSYFYIYVLLLLFHLYRPIKKNNVVLFWKGKMLYVVKLIL